MKTLYSIVEARGIVSDINSWSKTVNYIVSSKKTYIDSQLAPWMYDVHIAEKSLKEIGGIAAYDNIKSSLINGKLSIYINIDFSCNQSMIAGTLEHEFQHAFDDWIARTRRNMSNEMTDRYCIGTGYEMDEAPPLDLIDNPNVVTCDHFFCMFKQCTYFFEPTEVNAYAREFSIYLDSHELDFNEMLNDPHLMNMCGAGPLVWYNLLYSIPNYINQYTVDDDHVDFDYIVQGLHNRWSKLYLGRNINGSDSKNVVLNTINYILKHRANKMIKTYKRIINDHPGKATNIPNWLK